MTRRTRFFLSLGLSALLAAPALAQRPQRPQPPQGGRGGFGQGGVARLLTNESVQKELKLDKETADKAAAAAREAAGGSREQFAQLRDLPAEERRAKMREITQKANEATLKAIGGVLSADQMKRLKQIELQQAGADAFTRPDVQKALNLSDEQKEKIRTIADASAQEMRALMGGGQRGQGQRGQGQRGQGQRGQANPNFEKITALRKQTTEKVVAVLTADQQKSWKDLTGEPFTMSQSPRRRVDD